MLIVLKIGLGLRGNIKENNDFFKRDAPIINSAVLVRFDSTKFSTDEIKKSLEFTCVGRFKKSIYLHFN